MVSRNAKFLLFVCGGNTCRSPMAAALAKSILGNDVTTDSIGIDVGQVSSSPEAIKVMKEYGLDITRHRPRGISSINLNTYDLIIALSSSVQTELVNGL